MAKKPPYPFLKWAGGKARVAGRILARLPDRIGTYYEPFLGGGAIFLELARAGRLSKAVLSDWNPDLINCWQMVREDVDGLVKELRKKKYKYEKESYLKIRAADPATLSHVESAARFVYLNKTCFNGLYRVNGKGEFNVPFGRYDDPLICDETNLRAVSDVLKEVDVRCQDFEEVVESAQPGDAVYLDPPYLPVSDTSKFTSYTESGFSLEDHERLANVFEKLGRRAVRCVLSNSVAKDAKRLYADYDSDLFVGTRSIGGPAEFRKPAGEMIVFHGPRSVAKEAG